MANSNFVNIVKKYRENGLTCIPVDEKKQPLINWAAFQDRSMTDAEIEKHFSNVYGFAVLTGGKGSLELLDIDAKYFLDAGMYEAFKRSVPNSILQKLWVQTSMNGGYHFIYRCKVVEPNQKLAMRPTTREEKHATYIEEFEKGVDIDVALKTALNHKSLVTFETRGGTPEKSGGYFLCAPTPGYKKIFGKLQEISHEERNILLETARSFNQYFEKKKDYKLAKLSSDLKEGENPFENFNNKADGVQLLLDNGWTIVGKSSGKDVRFKRPGNSASKSSGLFDRDSNIFNCYSTSAGLESGDNFKSGTGYTLANIFIQLECEGDTQLAYRKLKELGY